MTGILGTSESRLSNFILGAGPSGAGEITDYLVFSELLTSSIIASYIEDNIVISDLASYYKINYRDTIDSLVIEEIASKVYDLTDSLTLIDSAVKVQYHKDTLIFSENLTYEQVHRIISPSEWVFTDFAFRSKRVTKSVSETLVFSDHTARAHFGTAGDTLFINELVDRPLIHTSILNFNESVVVKARLNRQINTTLSFYENRTKNINRTKTILDALNFLDNTNRSKRYTEIVNNSFSFSDHLARTIYFLTAQDSLIITASLINNKIIQQTPLDSLQITESSTLTKTLNLSTFDFILYNDGTLDDNLVIPPYYTPPTSTPNSPFIPSPFIPSTTTPPRAVVANQYITILGVSNALYLPPPEFNDYYKTLDQVVIKKSMTNTVRTLVKRNYQTVIHYDFVLTRNQANSFLYFFDHEHNSPLTIIDWKGLKWLVVLYSNSIDVVETGRWAPCGNRVKTSVEFIGKRIY